MKQPNFQSNTNSCGDLFTIDQFLEDVKIGMLIDYDGWGYFATFDNHDRNYAFYPSEITEKRISIPDWATHVLWFNR